MSVLGDPYFSLENIDAEAHLDAELLRARALGEMRDLAQCDRCGRDFRPDDDPFSPDYDYCPSCADHAVLCGCSDEDCEVW